MKKIEVIKRRWRLRNITVFTSLFLGLFLVSLISFDYIQENYIASDNEIIITNTIDIVKEEAPLVEDIEITVRKDETLSDILDNNGIKDSSLVSYKLIESLPSGRTNKRLFRNMKINDTIAIKVSQDKKLISMSYMPTGNVIEHHFELVTDKEDDDDPYANVTAQADIDQYTSVNSAINDVSTANPSADDDSVGDNSIDEEMEYTYIEVNTLDNAYKETLFFNGSIKSSFYEDGIASGMSDTLLLNTVDLFKWQIDFINDIRESDSFAVMVRNYYNQRNILISQEILAAQIVTRGNEFNLYRYEDKSGELIGFYNQKGESQRGRFLRMPIAFARVSSRFNPARRHPITSKIRPHRGVDYAAPLGTPIFSTASGVVVRAGYSRSYGNVVKIDHGNGYQTLYAHMRSIRKGIRKGVRVKQRQTIGYLGSTGISTGPHLHYEFLVNGVHRNPLTVRLSQKLPALKGDKLNDFLNRSSGYINLFDTYTNSIVNPIQINNPNEGENIDNSLENDTI